MKKQFFNKKGFTLVEALIGTALLAIFVSITLVGTTGMFGTGEKMMNISKAAVLGSDVMKAVTNEVRFGENFSFDETTMTINYDSASYGDNCTMNKNENGELVVVQTSSGADGYGGTSFSEKTFYPIGSAAYDEVHINLISFSLTEKKDEKGNVIRQTIICSVSITSDEGKILWENSVSIVPLYQKTSS